MAKLKVFRTPIGFHDAYVAAPSQKAALAAWGADANLFARGDAERVDDPALMEAPLARPGEVIRVRRGSDAEHFKALAAAKTPTPKKAARVEGQEPDSPPTKRSKSAAPPPPKPPAKKRPRPSRGALDRAEAALAQADDAFEAEAREIAQMAKALEDRRKRLREAHAARREKLEAARDRAARAYHARIAQWASR